MRLHSDVIEHGQITHAASVAGVTFDALSRHGSRTRDHAWEVKLYGSSSHRPNRGKSGEKYPADAFAATWDEWGVFLGVLFELDPRMVAGAESWGYVGAIDYDWQTGGRFAEPGTFDQWHKQHKFQYVMSTFLYSRHECKCGAVRQFRNGATTRERLGLDLPKRETVSA